MVGAGVFNIPTLGDDAVILRTTFGGAGVSTLDCDGSPSLYAGYVCTTLGGAPGFFCGI